MNLVSERRVQEMKVKRRGGASLRHVPGHFTKFTLNIPKHITEDWRLQDGQTMYLEHAGTSCILRTDRENEGDYDVSLTEYITRKYNGNTYTVMKITIPKGLALCLGIKKGHVVSVYESRDGIRLDF